MQQKLQQLYYSGDLDRAAELSMKMSDAENGETGREALLWHLEAGSTVILCLDNFEDGGSLAGKVTEMTQQRVADNSTMARYWSEDGTYWVNLTAERDTFSVSTKGYGVGRTLPAQAGEDVEIYTAQWISPERVQLMFTTQEGSRNWRAVYDLSSESVVFIEERS